MSDSSRQTDTLASNKRKDTSPTSDNCQTRILHNSPKAPKLALFHYRIGPFMPRIPQPLFDTFECFHELKGV